LRLADSLCELETVVRAQAKQYGKEYVGRSVSHFWSKEQRWFQAAVVSFAETRSDWDHEFTTDVIVYPTTPTVSFVSHRVS
jgi:hypothetical protein